MSLRYEMEYGIPRHVMLRAARQGDPFARLLVDPGAKLDPHPVYEEIRAAGPIVEGAFGFVTVSMDVATEVLKRHDEFSAETTQAGYPPLIKRAIARTRSARTVRALEPPSIVAVEPPDHTRLRRLIGSVSTPRSLEDLGPLIQSSAATLIDRMRASDGPVDFAGRFGVELPYTVIAHMLAIGRDEQAMCLRYGRATAASVDSTLTREGYREVAAATVEFNTWALGHFDRLRTGSGDDLFSRLVKVNVDGEVLSDAELCSFGGFLIAAGFVTTAELITAGTALMLDHPEQLRQVRESGDWANAIEEILRLHPPLRLTRRIATEDAVVHGMRIPRGRQVFVVTEGANRDPEVFEHPDVFDPARVNARAHLTFGSGRHFCIGAQLARMEARIALPMLFEALPQLRLLRQGTSPSWAIRSTPVAVAV